MKVAVLIDTDDWTRWNEVENYALRLDLTIEQALRQLVNGGLSHL